VEPSARACIGRDWPWTAGRSRRAPDTTEIGRRPFLSWSRAIFAAWRQGRRVDTGLSGLTPSPPQRLGVLDEERRFPGSLGSPTVVAVVGATGFCLQTGSSAPRFGTCAEARGGAARLTRRNSRYFARFLSNSRRPAAEEGRRPPLTTAVALAEHFAVLRDMFGQARRYGSAFPGQQGDPARGRATRGGVSDQRRDGCRCSWAWLRLVHLEAV
jgi:hypothetical protein